MNCLGIKGEFSTISEMPLNILKTFNGVFVTFTSYSSIPWSSCRLISILRRPLQLPLQKKIKWTKQVKNIYCHESALCHTEYPFIHRSLLANVHWIESLFGKRPLNFPAINTGSSLGLLLDIPLLPWVMVIPQPWIWGLVPHVTQQFTDGVDIGVSQVKALDLGLDGSWDGWFFGAHISVAALEKWGTFFLSLQFTCMGVWLVCIAVYNVCAVPTEARRGHQIRSQLVCVLIFDIRSVFLLW